MRRLIFASHFSSSIFSLILRCFFPQNKQLLSQVESRKADADLTNDEISLQNIGPKTIESHMEIDRFVIKND